VQPSDGAAAAGQCQNEWPWPGVLTGFCSSRSSSDSSGHAKNDYVCTSRKVASATWVNARWNWQSILIHFGKSFLCVGSCVESAECPRQVCLMLDQLAEISPRSHCHSFRIPHISTCFFEQTCGIAQLNQPQDTTTVVTCERSLRLGSNNLQQVIHIYLCAVHMYDVCMCTWEGVDES